MLPPALLLMRFGRWRWLILPLPLFLLWPVLLLAWGGLGLIWLVTADRSRPGFVTTGLTTLRALGELRGTKIDVREQDSSVYLRFM